MDGNQKSLYSFWNNKKKNQNDSKNEIQYDWDDDIDDEMLNSAYEQSIK